MALASSQTTTNQLAEPQLRAQTAPPEAVSPKSVVDHLQNAQLRAQTAPPEAVSPNTVSSNTTASHLAEPQFRAQTAPPGAAPPTLLRCIIISWSDQRADLFRTVAENESWETVVCGDTGQFMRNIFRFKYPLTIVDLPNVYASDYEDLRNATERSRAVSDSLLVVSVLDETRDDEIWARQLGAWAHLPGVANSPGLEVVFREARQALARQETTYAVREDSGVKDK